MSAIAIVDMAFVAASTHFLPVCPCIWVDLVQSRDPSPRRIISYISRVLPDEDEDFVVAVDGTKLSGATTPTI